MVNVLVNGEIHKCLFEYSKIYTENYVDFIVMGC